MKMDDKFRDSISGITEKVIYHNLKTGACRILVSIKSKNTKIELIGIIPSIAPGEYIMATGSWRKGPNKLEFKAVNLKTSLPNSIEDIENYLGSGHFFGIGKYNAGLLSKEFGDKIFTIIEHQPALLTKIKGFGKLRAKRISEHLRQQKKMRDVLLFLEYYEISIANAVMLFKTYNHDALAIIKADPYKLVLLDIVDFQKADYIAKDINLPSDSKVRLLAAIRYIISIYPHDKPLYADILVQETARVLGDVKNKTIEEVVSYAIENSLISVN
jgi:exodeoxyribonuclease V alpha subunit